MISKMTIGKKMAAGFSVVLIMLTVVAVLSYFGISTMDENIEDAIHKNELVEHLTLKEVDHLNWAAAVSELLTNDQVHELNVQTDDHQCAFGKWLYGAERTDAEQQIPSLAKVLAISFPSPLPEPVISATRPCNFTSILLSKKVSSIIAGLFLGCQAKKCHRSKLKVNYHP